MATKLWIRTNEGRPAILVRTEGAKGRFSVGDKERVVSTAESDRLPLWTGLSPFLNEGPHGASDATG